MEKIILLHEDFIKEEYYNGHKSFRQIGKELGVNFSKIAYLFKIKGWKPRNNSEAKRTYNLDEHYFDEINTPNKAYIFGYMCADGYCNPITRGMILTLSVKDEEILIRIKEEMKSEAPLFYYDGKEKKDGSKRKFVRLSIYNKNIFSIYHS